MYLINRLPFLIAVLISIEFISIITDTVTPPVTDPVTITNWSEIIPCVNFTAIDCGSGLDNVSFCGDDGYRFFNPLPNQFNYCYRSNYTDVNGTSLYNCQTFSCPAGTYFYQDLQNCVYMDPPIDS